jgi:hypothetical protein
MSLSLRAEIPRALTRVEATAVMLDGAVAADCAVVYWNVADKSVQQDVSSFAVPDLADLLPARRLGTHPRARNRISHFASGRDGHALMLEAESRLEMHHLRALDMDPSVEGLHTQPFILVWQVGDAAIYHFPDILALRSGHPLVVDVKPDALTDDFARLIFALTAAALTPNGVEYRLAGSVSPQSETNHMAIRRWKIVDPRLARVAEHVASQRPATAHHALSMSGGPKIGREVLFHLLANGRCRIDMDQPIHRATKIDWSVGA